MPISRAANTVPSSRISTGLPITRVSSFQTGRAGESVTPQSGTPIGLLLILTYSETFTPVSYSDFRPSTRVVST